MYLNVFRHCKKADFDRSAYTRDAEQMEKLARLHDGFIAFRRYTSSDGEFLSISEWRSKADAKAWARHPDHIAMQAKARADYYQSYTIYSCDQPDIRCFDVNSGE